MITYYSIDSVKPRSTIFPCYFDFSEVKEQEEMDRISADIRFSIRNYLSNGTYCNLMFF